jgi:hypothetical protein
MGNVIVGNHIKYVVNIIKHRCVPCFRLGAENILIHKQQNLLQKVQMLI